MTTMAPTPIVERVQRLFIEDLELEVERETDLIDSGILDSLAFVRLIALLEERFGVTTNLATLEMEHFGSVVRIAAYVDRERSPNGNAV